MVRLRFCCRLTQYFLAGDVVVGMKAFKLFKSHPSKSADLSASKQFLLSLIATTVSIALTFGTSAIADHHKKQQEKHEIVMMVMYDMYNTLQQVEQNNDNIYHAIDLQLQVAEDTSLFDEKTSIDFTLLQPILTYSETVEKIFSSSVESINTLGSVLFVENVAEFYRCRSYYKNEVCTAAENESERTGGFATLKSTLDYSFSHFVLLSSATYMRMNSLFKQCQEMMEISDAELDTYSKQRSELDSKMSIKDSVFNRIDEANEKQLKLNSLKSKLNLK